MSLMHSYKKGLGNISIPIFLWNLIWESWCLIFSKVKQIRPTEQSPHHKSDLHREFSKFFFSC